MTEGVGRGERSTQGILLRRYGVTFDDGEVEALVAGKGVDDPVPVGGEAASGGGRH